MHKNELENLIKENFKDTALRIYELDNEDRKSLLAEYREWIMNDLDFEEVMMLPYEAYTDNNKVKVFFDDQNIAKKFEREAKLNIKDFRNYDIYKHIGIYAFRTNILNKIIDLSPTENEKKLNLEQVRWMENNYSIHIGITEFDPFSVDNLEDIEKIIPLHIKND